MSVIIRLQNLPWSANAMDIRTYFRGLSIPEGGVHIVGGEMGDAFIAFSTDEDARQAMMSDGGKIKDVQVKLFLSSRAEMQKIIETARQQAMAFMGIAPQPPIISSLLAQSLQHNDLNTRSVDNDKDDNISRNDDNRDNSVREDSKKGGRDRDRSSRSRSRDRRRERSRSRERRDRRKQRDRSRSRDRRGSRRRDSRRDRSRDHSRERTRERDSRRSKDGKRDDDEKSKSKSGSPISKKGSGSQVWENSSNNGNSDLNRSNNGFGGANIMNGQQQMPLLGNNGFKSWTAAPSINFNAEQLSRLQNLEGRRNPTAFQNTTNSTLFNQTNPLILNSNRGTCIHMINLDPTTSYNEIRAIFSKLQIAQNGIKIVNEKHSGKRTAYVRFSRLDHKIQALACNGQNIRGKLVEVRTIDDQQFEEAEDTCRPPPSTVLNSSIEIDSDTDGELQIVDDSNNKALIMPPNQNPHENPNLGFTVLKLDGIPTFAKEHHIMKMFSDYSVMNIYLIEGAGSMCPKDTRKQHLAFVEFHRAADAAFALNDDSRHIIGHKTITITSSTKKEMQEAKERNVVSNDIPVTSNIADEKQNSFLKDPRQRRVDDINPKFLMSNNLMTKSLQDQSSTLQSSTIYNQMDFNRAPPIGQNMEQINGFQDRIETDWVVLNNLPVKISDRDIMDFFSDVGLVPCRLHLLLGNQNIGGQRDGGRCFCRFEGGPDSVRRACTKDGMPLGMSRISVTPVLQSLVEEATGSKEAPPSVFMKPPPSFQQQPQQLLPNQSQGQQQQFAPPLMNLNISQPLLGPQSLLGPPPMMRGEGLMNMRRPPPLFGGRGARGRGSFLTRGRGGPFPGSFPRNHGPPPPQTNDIAGVDGFGAPGCVVSMENVPFRAGVEEILEFFRGFDIPRENVIRRFNDQGNPTGDAKVAFSTPQDAQRAVESCLARGPNCKIRDRRIYMTIT